MHREALVGIPSLCRDPAVAVGRAYGTREMRQGNPKLPHTASGWYVRMHLKTKVTYQLPNRLRGHGNWAAACWGRFSIAGGFVFTAAFTAFGLVGVTAAGGSTTTKRSLERGLTSCAVSAEAGDPTVAAVGSVRSVTRGS